MATDRDFDVIVIARRRSVGSPLHHPRKAEDPADRAYDLWWSDRQRRNDRELPWPPASIRGIDLAVNMLDQIKPYGLQTAFTEVEALHVDRRPFVVVTGLGSYTGKVVILAVGAR
jgi:hypothetical protein